MAGRITAQVEQAAEPFQMRINPIAVIGLFIPVRGNLSVELSNLLIEQVNILLNLFNDVFRCRPLPESEAARNKGLQNCGPLLRSARAEQNIHPSPPAHRSSTG